MRLVGLAQNLVDAGLELVVDLGGDNLDDFGRRALEQILVLFDSHLERHFQPVPCSLSDLAAKLTCYEIVRMPHFFTLEGPGGFRSGRNGFGCRPKGEFDDQL